MKVFVPKLKKIQCNTALGITGAIRGMSQIKLYREMGLESLRFRRWFRQLYTSFKMKIHGKPKYSR